MGGGGEGKREWRDGDVVWLMSSLMGPVTHYFQALSSCLYREEIGKESGQNQIFQSQVQRVHYRVLLHSGRSCSSAEKTCDVLLATTFAIFASWHSCNSRYYDVLVHVS